MKTCPICGSRAFDDAAVCYGCLHRFEKDEKELTRYAGTTPLPSFLIRLRAIRISTGETEWVCEVSPEPLKVPSVA